MDEWKHKENENVPRGPKKGGSRQSCFRKEIEAQRGAANATAPTMDMNM